MTLIITWRPGIRSGTLQRVELFTWARKGTDIEIDSCYEYQSKAIKVNTVNNTTFPGQRILNIVLLLTIIACISILLAEHSFRSLPYLATILYLVMGVTNVYSGLMKLRIAARNGQPVVWYRQNTLLLGISFLFLGLLFLMEYIIADKLSNSIRGAVEISALIVLGIPFLFFAIRSITSSVRNLQ